MITQNIPTSKLPNFFVLEDYFMKLWQFLSYFDVYSGNAISPFLLIPHAIPLCTVAGKILRHSIPININCETVPITGPNIFS